jgi:hypothetical protein
LLAERTGTPLHQFHYWGKGDDKDARQTQVTPMFLEHGLALASVRIAMERAALANGCTIEVWHDEITLRRNKEWDSVMVAFSPGRQQERIPVRECLEIPPPIEIATAEGPKPVFTG